MVLLELGPGFVFRSLLLSELVKLLGHLAPLNELVHLLVVLLAHVLRVGWVLSLQKNGEQLQHRLLHRQGWVLESVLTDFSKGASDHRAQCLGHEGLRIILLEVRQKNRVLVWRHLDWQLNCGVSRRTEEEFGRFLLRSKDEAIVLKRNDRELVAFNNAILVFKRHGAMTQKLLLLSDNLRSLVEAKTLGDVALMGEVELCCEANGVLNED